MESELKPIFEAPAAESSESLQTRTEERFPHRKKLPGGVPTRTDYARFIVDRQRFPDLPTEESDVARGVLDTLREARLAVTLALTDIKLYKIPGYSHEEFYAILDAPSNYLEKYYGDLGVDDVPKDLEATFTPDDLMADELDESAYFDVAGEAVLRLKKSLLNPEIRGERSPDYIFIKVPRQGIEGPEQRALWEIEVKSYVAHEKYHSLAAQIIQMRKDKDQEGIWRFSFGRTGLVYPTESLDTKKRSENPARSPQKDRKHSSPALEEGLAVLFEHGYRMSLLDTSEIGAWYKRTIKETAKNIDIPEECLIIKEITPVPDNPENVAIDYFFSWYEDSVRLVKFLRAELEKRGHDFHVLAEEARIHQKTISLAKAVEAVFGKGTYRKLAVTTEDGAKELLDELRGIVDETENTLK